MSLGILILGGVFFIDKLPYAIFLITTGGLGFAAYCFMSAFKPIHEEPNWELVYPELALSHIEELDHSKTEKDDSAGK